jgi:hypothetical protein
VVVALGVMCLVVVVVLVLVLRTARDGKLGRFKFSLSASLLKVCTFGIVVETQREPTATIHAETPPRTPAPAKMSAPSAAGDPHDFDTERF